MEDIVVVEGAATAKTTVSEVASCWGWCVGQYRCSLRLCSYWCFCVLAFLFFVSVNVFDFQQVVNFKHLFLKTNKNPVTQWWGAFIINLSYIQIWSVCISQTRIILSNWNHENRMDSNARWILVWIKYTILKFLWFMTTMIVLI